MTLDTNFAWFSDKILQGGDDCYLTKSTRSNYPFLLFKFETWFLSCKQPIVGPNFPCEYASGADRV